jgi:acid stress-induced BolA-like protein IbaG/YrbA
MEFAQKLEKVLQSACPDGAIHLDTASGGTVSVLIVWDGFADKTDRARQQYVWGKLLAEDTFKRKDLQTITLILTSTPEEHELLRDYPPEED